MDLFAPDGKNKLIMFRTNEKSINNGYDQVIGYSVGYRVSNEYLDARIFMEIGLEGLTVHIDFTPKVEIEAELGIYNNDKRCVHLQSENEENPSLFTPRRYNINLKLGVSK